MERTIGVDKARARLGQLAEEVAAEDEAVVLTRRGEVLAVIVSPAEYERLTEARRRVAREELRERLAQVRKSVADAGLDVSVIDEAIAAARTVA
ncbi:MAG: type II toxin-antitoxin system prevent-host-death family antitoxin [Actinomycetota bacterium]|jgi:prevent-host-death family protein|nr:type II toxin-antitoxin system prevent-host-death family antitoxin [Actinomycetota bacterium]